MFSVVGVIYFFFFFFGETKTAYLPATTMCVKDPPHSTGSQQQRSMQSPSCTNFYSNKLSLFTSATKASPDDLISKRREG